MSLTVNMKRLRADLESLSSIGRRSGGGITRTSFSADDLAGREWYQARCAAAGLAVATDGIGNMFAEAAGTASGSTGRSAAAPGAAAVWSGSHLDTVPDGGAFDGAVGAVAALECVRRLAEEQVELDRPVRAVVFADEEGNYNHLLGSTALTRDFTRDELAAMTGRDGDRLIDAITALGWNPDGLTGNRADPARVHAFVELHIEQGPNLEASGTDIGVVTSIVAIGGAVVEFRGRADHAGTTPMTRRQDPLRAAAQLIGALPSITASVSDAAVATCGKLVTFPGGANVVPGRVRMLLDYRDPDAGRLARLDEQLASAARQAASAHDVTLCWEAEAAVAPVELDPRVRSVIDARARGLGLSAVAMPSGAGHDAQNMAALAPTGMIFIPSRDGRSHSPAEHTGWDDIENGANVLLASLTELATTGLADPGAASG
ncbi:MAG TPA: Zn-dependent hydrolase [Streptosporangiaceae bacterium]